MKIPINLIGWIFHLGISACALLLIPRPLGDVFDPTSSSSAWLLLQVSIFIGAIAPRLWLESVLITKNLGVRSTLMLLRFLWLTQIGFFMFLALVAILGDEIYSFLQSGRELFPYSILYSATLALVNLALLLRPPVAIVLTGSQSNSLMAMVSSLLYPLRVVALLDNRSLGMTTWFRRVDNLRTIPQANWRDLVRHLVDVVPLVIVDTSVPGKSLEFETGLMVEPSRVRKAVFVRDLWGDTPSLDIHQDKLREVRPAKLDLDQLPLFLQVVRHGAPTPRRR